MRRWLAMSSGVDGWHVEVLTSGAGGRTVIIGLRITQTSDEEVPITAERLRNLQLRRIRTQVADFYDAAELEERTVPRRTGAALPFGFYEQVSDEYRAAVAIGRPPVKRLALVYNVPHSTAARWVDRARVLGVLEKPAKPGMVSVPTSTGE